MKTKYHHYHHQQKPHSETVVLFVLSYVYPHLGAMNAIDSVGEGGGLMVGEESQKACEEEKHLQIVSHHSHQEVCLLVNM